MFKTEYKTMSGQIVVLPEGFRLRIEETSNCVYQIDMFDKQMRSIKNHGTDLDDMIEKAIEDLIKMNN
jgi:hypothetical protein